MSQWTRPFNTLQKIDLRLGRSLSWLSLTLSRHFRLLVACLALCLGLGTLSTNAGTTAFALMGGAMQNGGVALNDAGSANAVTVSTLAGIAGDVYSAGTFNYPGAITTDGTNLYVADTGTSTIRKVVIATGEVSTLAGTGNQGYADGVGTAASFWNPEAITTDGTNLYVADTGTSTIRKVVIATGEVSTLAGVAPGGGNYRDGSGKDALFSYPAGITTDGTNLYVADRNNHAIRRVDSATGAVTTLAGSGFPTLYDADGKPTDHNSKQGSADGTGYLALFKFPKGITTDGTNLYVADRNNNTIRKVVIATGEVTTLAGSAAGVGSADGVGPAAQFNLPEAITTDGTNLYVADTYNYTIRKVVITTGAVATLAGSAGLRDPATDGAGTAALFYMPKGITTDGTNLYVADSANSTVRKISSSDGVSTTSTTTTTATPTTSTSVASTTTTTLTGSGTSLNFSNPGDGTVTDSTTGLVWMRCSMGQTWDGSTCIGFTGNSYSWDEARTLTTTFAGHSDWRLPNYPELQTIVDRSRAAPTIDPGAFPNTPATNFWSASEDPNYSYYAWYVDFYDGNLYSYDKFQFYLVRLVRGEQYSGSSTSTTTTTSTSTSSTTSTTATSATTTTVSGTTTTTQAGSSATLNLVAGWNLVGNSSTGSLDMASAFSDTTKVTTIWKWIANGAKWAFYAPSLAGPALTDYATGKGYDVLTTVNAGEGFWVNAKTTFTAQLPAGTAVQSASFRNMAAGWSLIAIGDNSTPNQFNVVIGATTSSAGIVPVNLTTLWAWDAAQINWYFYAPSLEISGGLASYVASKSYLYFGSKALDPTMGFWVNVPVSSTGAFSLVGIWKYSLITADGTSTAILTFNADGTFTEDVNIFIMGSPGGCSYAGGTYVVSGNTITTVNKPTSATRSGMMPATSCNTTDSFKDAAGTVSASGDTLTLTDASGSVILIRQ